MTVALQIRDVPEDVRDVIAARAAERGQSVQAYLLDMVRREARYLTNVATLDRTAHHRVAIPEELAPERLIREDRDAGFEVDRGPSPT